MEIVDIDNAKKGDDSICVKITLDKNNISKFPIQTLYCKERGFSKFLLKYKYENINDNLEKLTYKIRNQIFNLVKDHNFIFYISGFPRCVFETAILPASKKYDFKDKIIYYEDNNTLLESEKTYYRCLDCGYQKKCVGINEDYLAKQNFNYGPLESKENLLELYEEEFSFFYDEEIKKYCELTKKDFLNTKEFGEKKIFFKKRISNGSDEFKEGFFYTIYTYNEAYDELIEFLYSIFNKVLIDEYHLYIKKTNKITLGFEVLSDDSLRKRIYISTSNMKQDDKINLFNKLNFDYNKDLNIIGVYLEENNNSFKVIECKYEIGDCDIPKVKEYFKSIQLEQKRLFLKFLNSLTKKINSLIYIEKFDSDIIISKKIEFKILDNPTKIKNIGILYGSNLKFYDDKELISILFEASDFQHEKIVFNYTMKMKEPITEEEKMYQKAYQKNYTKQIE